jgi:TRAP-type C4-dicarboxylate transport system permease small subunit
MNGMSPEAAFLGPGVLTLCLAIQLVGVALYVLSYLLPAAGRAICRVFAWIFVVGFFIVSMSWYGFMYMVSSAGRP